MLTYKPFNILYFQTKKNQTQLIGKLNALIKNYKDWVKVHTFVLSPENKLLFKRYGVISSAIYVIRPDGYVGFRMNADKDLWLEEYLKNFFK